MQQRLGVENLQSTRSVWGVLAAACIVVGIAMGLRQVMGLYLKPVTTELGIGREPFSLAMAIANLVWGLAAVPLGAVADRYGTGRILVMGTLATIAGVLLMYVARSELYLLLSGVLIGIGVGGTGITALVGAVSRAVPPEQRPQAIAALGMASGIGAFIAFPYIHLFIELLGWQGSLLVTIATLAVIIPLALPLSGKPEISQDIAKDQSILEAMSEAFAYPSFWLLKFGFFVCGFHVAFYSVHLPAFVADAGLPAWVAVAALTAVGIANIIGTFLAGQSTKFFPKRFSLSFIYLMRCSAFLALLYFPIDAVTIISASAILGLFWLSTVPLTSAMVATFFGPQWMSMLFGIVFLSHQIGSFVGLWLAGYLYDATNSYNTMWWISIALGLFAALVHLPIREKPVARLLDEAVFRLRIKLTPYAIDLGTKVIQISHVTSAAVRAYYPLRPIGLILILVTAGFLALDMVKNQSRLLYLPTSSTSLWIACAGTILGLGMTFMLRWRIVIRTVDGSVTRVRGDSYHATCAYIAKIGQAINSAAAARDPTYSSFAPSEGQMIEVPGPKQSDLTIGPSVVPSMTDRPVDHASDRMVNRLYALMSSVDRSDVAHKSELLHLLEVVVSYHSGSTTRDNAIAHWRSFADYVRQYLSDQELLLSQIDSLDREMRAP
ncbi:MAG: MFS transporter [Hyphomicrobiaceae bacterium]